MYRRSQFVALIVLLCSPAILRGETKPAPVDETQEPPLKYELKLGDQTLSITEGATVEASGTFTNPKVTLTPEPHRTFPYGGLSFRYPRAFVFEADVSDPDVKTWTLSGNDLTILVFVFSDEVTTEAFAGGMAEQFGEENSRITSTDARIPVGEKVLRGTQMDVVLAGQQLQIDILHIPTKAEGTTLLVLQDSRGESGKPSKERTGFGKLLSDSLKFE
jgi:hypothetical protein